MRGLPISFFEKTRPNVKDIEKREKSPDDEIVPFAWSKDVLDGKTTNDIILTMPKDQSKNHIKKF